MKGLKYLKNGTVEFSKNLHLKTIGPKVLKKYHLKNVPFFEGLGPYLTGLHAPRSKKALVDNVEEKTDYRTGVYITQKNQMEA